MGLIENLAIILLVAGIAGWIFQRLGFSSVAGYLIAGALIGPHSLGWIPHSEEVESLVQLGLVFLMFSIGLELSLNRLKSLGPIVLISAIVSFFFIYNVVQLTGWCVGIQGNKLIFLAAMLMVCSSAIVGKILHEMGGTHNRSSQIALSYGVAEDVLTIVMLAILGTISHMEQLRTAQVAHTIGLLAAFIILILVLAMLVVPRFLARLDETAGLDVQTILAIGLMLGLAWLAYQVGYSLAIGAILLGAVMGSTKYRPQIERVSQGLKDVFAAVFFVGIGMLFDIRSLSHSWSIVLCMAGAALLLRPLAISFGLTLVGQSYRDAIRAGLILIPLGEFSFIVAQLGIEAKILPRDYYSIAVAFAILTALISPVITRHSEKLSFKIAQILPSFLIKWVGLYANFIKTAADRGTSHVLWKLSGKRFLQIIIQILFLSGLLIYSEDCFRWMGKFVGRRNLFPYDLEIISVFIFGILFLVPGVSLWRNISALCLLYSEVVTMGTKVAKMQMAVEIALKSVCSIFLVLWLVALLPVKAFNLWTSVGMLAALALFAAFFWKKIIRVHSHFEYELGKTIEQDQIHARSHSGAAEILNRRSDWALSLREVELPDHAACAGRTLLDLNLRKIFSCSVVSIERQGYAIHTPPAEMALYPMDKVLLLGGEDTVENAEAFLKQETQDGKENQSNFDEMVTEPLIVEKNFSSVGKSLIELEIPKKYGVQIAALRRDGKQIDGMNASFQIKEGDEILLVGTSRQILDLAKDWASSTPET